MSFWPFVVTLVLLLVSVYLWYEASKDAEKDKSTIVSLQAQLTAANSKVAAPISRLDEIATAMGSSYNDTTVVENVPTSPSQTSIFAANGSYVEKAREKGTTEVDSWKYVATGTGGSIEKLANDKVKIHYLQAKGETSSLTTEQAFTMLVDALGRSAVDIKRYIEQHAALQKKNEELEKAQKAALETKDKAAADIRAQAAAAQQALEAQIREVKDQLAAAQAQVQQVQGEIDQVKAQSEQKVAAAASQLNQVKAELQTAKRMEQPLLSDGMDGGVLNAGAGLVIIDLGKKHMLRPGTEFTVYGKVKGGALLPKGKIKVVTCGEDSSDCIVLDQDPSNPIASNDQIESKLYSKDRQYHFVLLGDFKKMGKAQAEAKLKSLGAAIDAKVGATTNYLVVGSPSAAGEVLEETDAWKLAKEYGITILTEDMLASMTMY
jgi:NAD-dependent DNA ligase